MASRDEPASTPVISPHDTLGSSATRFCVELIAWVAGPWAVRDATNSWLATLGSVVFLVGLPAIFNTPGDKKATGVPTPGPVRVAIEALLGGAAACGAWLAWPRWAAVLVLILLVTMIFTGLARYLWLLTGAQTEPETHFTRG